MSPDGWILAGIVDGELAAPAPLDPVCGLPHLLRHALALAQAGVGRVCVVWGGGPGAPPPPELARLAADPRLGGLALTVEREPPQAAGPVLLARADRVMHRDLARRVAEAGPPPVGGLLRLELDGADAGVYLADAGLARELAAASPRPGALDALVAARAAAAPSPRVEPPHRAFSVPAPDAGALAAAERRMLRSLRMPTDGLAGRYNRYVSLTVTRLLMRTRVRPNHVSAFNLALGVAGGLTCALGGFAAGVGGALLNELASVLDGTDGELARLRYEKSKVGEWLDTISDDLANLSFMLGMAANLHGRGVGWALPVGLGASSAFVAAQLTIYWFLARLFRSGNLLAFRWDFQAPATDAVRPGPVARLVGRVQGIFRRDFVVTAFVLLALLDRLDVALAGSAAGAVVFLVALLAQVARLRSRPLPAVSP